MGAPFALEYSKEEKTMKTEIVFHKIEIRRGGKKFGDLWIDKKCLQWKPVHSRRCTNITWAKFDQLMRSRP
jgi:hypothetical protein